MTALLELRNVSRSYPSGEEQVAVLKDISLQIHAGEMVAIVGVSGSGKSTLMNILGCLDKPTSGTYRVAGRDVSTLDPDALAQLRREHFGFIFQRYHLLSHLTAAQNVEIPAVYAGIERKKRQARARRAPESCFCGCARQRVAFAAGIKRSRRLPTFTAFWRTAAACQ
ncbi:Macrolide export ATP-binding/permease protein MacB, partial [Salmonella enterica subsp. enterica serovar Rubislaw str. A4-653]